MQKKRKTAGPKKTKKKTSKKAKKAKKAAKRGSSKNIISKSFTSVRKVMYVAEPVPEQYVFYLQDGRVLRNLGDLINSLETMSDELFDFHANDHKNDFSNWIRDIIDEHDLSVNICGKSRSDTKREVLRFLKKRGSLKG